MMNISDIIQIVVLCAVMFVPGGYLICRHSTTLIRWFRRMFVRPRYIRPDGYLYRDGVDEGKAGHGG